MYLKVCILYFHVEDIDSLYLVAVGSYLLGIYIIHQWLYQSPLLDAAHIKTIHIVPEVNLFLPAMNTYSG